MRSEPRSARTPVWPLSISLAATLEIDVSFSSSGYLDVSVHRVPFHTLWIGVWMTGVLPAGFPHSDIRGSLNICFSPRLFAAYHVFLRLLVPRHPPCALFCLTYSPFMRSVAWTYSLLSLDNSLSVSLNKQTRCNFRYVIGYVSLDVLLIIMAFIINNLSVWSSQGTYLIVIKQSYHIRSYLISYHCLIFKFGGHLLSHRVAPAVSSAG